MVKIVVAASGDAVAEGTELDRRARIAGRIIAEHGCDLLTGGGGGAMEIVAKSFCGTPLRVGRSIGIIPGSAQGFAGARLGHVSPYALTPKSGYPNRWIELPIFTHLPGTAPKSAESRNIMNMASADMVIVLKGGEGTQAELEIALGLGKSVIAFVGPEERIGNYQAGSLPKGVIVVPDELSLQDALRDMLSPFALARPAFSAIRAVYKTDPTQIHNCTMHFPNTCAIRMSEALDKTVTGIKEKFANSGVNLCPHNFVRGAGDLAGILRKAEVFGVYDIGLNAPGTAPASVQGKKGLVAYLNIPDFPGQGHIDLWDGSNPVGADYWNADPIWFWKLP